jgi:hypothetical protein
VIAEPVAAEGYKDGPHSSEGWRAQIEACRKRRERFLTNVWQTNVSFRVQRPFSQASADEADTNGTDQIAVPADWSRTRSKSAALFSQLPRISLDATLAATKPAVPIFEKIANHFIPLAGAASVMEECMADLVNASGMCAATAQYEATFKTEQVPSVDVSPYPPDQIPQLIQAKLIPTQDVKRVVSERYRWYRISPSQLLWPIDFTGSDWQRARWLGYEGTLPWARARDAFHLSEADKDDVCSAPGSTTTARTLSGDQTRELQAYDELVKFQEIYYWRALCDPEERHFDCIWRLVFVSGKDEPVIDEPWAGQQLNEQTNEYIGCTRLPIEVAVITYVSDRAVPPSDSEIGRAMVLEQMRSRSQMIMQRTRNLPVRTFDVNRIDPAIADLLMKGIWQGMIPVNGPGERVLSQIAAAAFPKEDFSFDSVSNRDLDDAWSMSPNQMGNYNTGERSASEAQFVQSAYASVIGFQRQKVVQMFLGLVETTLGLIQLTLDDYEAQAIVGPDGVQRLQTWDRQMIAGKYVATIRQDASVLQDASSRTRQLMQFLNIAGKSGRINIDPIIAELAALSGLDPAEVMAPPPQQKPDDPNLSVRLGGLADLLHPLSMGLLIHSGQAPTAQDIENAKQLLLDAAGPPQQPVPSEVGIGAAQVADVHVPTAPPKPPIAGGPPPGPQAPRLPTLPQRGLPPGPPNKDWQAMERVTKRPDELGG